MRDFARSNHPGVQAQLDRLSALALPQGRIGLDAIARLLERLGNPQLTMPPVLHVAGTNGKGSTTAYLRAILERAGYRVHATTSPHLVRYNERIRLAGQLIADAALASLLCEVLDASEDLRCSFFEVTIAASFLAFSRHPGDVCVVEVGLGGRLDATNVLAAPLVCCVASLGIDHESFLLTPEAGAPDVPMARIAWEKAGIAKRGTPLVTQNYEADAAKSVIATAAQQAAPLLMRGRDWWAEIGTGIAYRDSAGTLDLPLPGLPGAHQADNAALAVAVLRHQTRLPISAEAFAAGIRAARWPARLELLGQGPLTAGASAIDQVWLDGGHNPDAARVVAQYFTADLKRAGPIDVIIGMLANKDAAEFLRLLGPVCRSLIAVPISGHDCHTDESLRDWARQAGIPQVSAAPDVATALASLNASCGLESSARRVLITGSLYLAGEVLRGNAELPD